MGYIFQQGDTSKSIRVEVLDAATGDGVTGLDASTFPDVSYVVGSRTAPVALGALNDLSLVTSPWNAKGVIELGAADPGGYRLDLPDLALASEDDFEVAVVVFGSGFLRRTTRINLTPYNPYVIDKSDYALAAATIDDIAAEFWARVFPKLANGTLTAAEVLTAVAAPYFNKSNGPNRGSAGTVNIRNGADNANLLSQAVNANGYHTAAPTINLGGS
jgi:hypothetical protein